MKNKGSENNGQILYTANFEVSPIITQLIRQILENAVKYRSELSIVEITSPAEDEEVVLAVNIDGFRYTLIRSVQGKGTTELRFSPREIEIIRLVCKGMANKEIASLLEISQWTVGTYLRRLYMKLAVNSRTELVAKILHSNL